VIINVENRSLLGSLVFVGAAQLILVMTVAEALYPGYNMATNYISDLGVGSTALFFFNASAVLFGVMAFIGAVSGKRSIGTLIAFTLALTGAGAVGVGLFPETTGAPHYACALIAFVFGALSAILSYRVTHRPLSIFFVVLGVIALAALILYLTHYDILYLTHYDLSIGRGGMERMIVYSSLVWALGFGGSLIGST
jgi:hypothetical membrane protein